jgi:hypothetical protein
MGILSSIKDAYSHRQEKKKLYNKYGHVLCNIGIGMLCQAEKQTSRPNSTDTLYAFKELLRTRYFAREWIVWFGTDYRTSDITLFCVDIHRLRELEEGG